MLDMITNELRTSFSDGDHGMEISEEKAPGTGRRAA